MAIISSLSTYAKNPQVKSIAIYTFSNFFNKGVSFLLLFYFTRVLSESDFGMLSIFSNSILFLMPFISLGIIQSVNTDFFKLDKPTFKDFFTTTFSLPFIMAVLSIAVLFLFRNSLQQRYNFPPVFILIIPIITLFNFINEQLTVMIRNNHQPIQFLIVNIGRLLTEIALAVFFISAMQYGWIGRVTGIFISYLAIAVYAIYYFKKQDYLFGTIQKKFIYDELVYSIPIIGMQVAVFCLSSSAVYYVAHFSNNLSEVGIYSVAATFASVVTVFCSALLQYVHPKIYSLLSQKEIDFASIRRQFVFYAGVMLAGTVAVIAITPLVYYYLLKQSYLPGLKYYYFICIGYFFWAIAYFFLAFMLYRKEKKKIGAFSIISVAISVMSNWFFTKNFGNMGTAIATAVSFFLVMIVCFLFVRKQIVPILQYPKQHNYE